MARFVPSFDRLDVRLAPSPGVPAGSPELPPLPPVPVDPAPVERDLEWVEAEAMMREAIREYDATLDRLERQILLVQELERETWYSQALDALDAALRSFVDSQTPMFPSVP